MRTALDLSPDERRGFLEAVRRRLTAWSRGEPDLAGVEALRARAREVATLLRVRFGARRVVLFGSLAHTAWPTTTSDVDLAVEGLSAEAYWQARAMVEEQFPDRAVDLVALETATESLRSAIEKSGIEL